MQTAFFDQLTKDASLRKTVSEAVSDPGFPGNLRNCGLEKALLREYFDRCFKDAVIFVIYFFFGTNNGPPEPEYFMKK